MRTVVVTYSCCYYYLLEEAAESSLLYYQYPHIYGIYKRQYLLKACLPIIIIGRLASCRGIVPLVLLEATLITLNGHGFFSTQTSLQSDTFFPAQSSVSFASAEHSNVTTTAPFAAGGLRTLRGRKHIMIATGKHLSSSSSRMWCVSRISFWFLVFKLDLTHCCNWSRGPISQTDCSAFASVIALVQQNKARWIFKLARIADQAYPRVNAILAQHTQVRKVRHFLWISFCSHKNY